MSIPTFLVVKFAVVVAAAAVWGLFCGLTGRDLSGRRVDRRTQADLSPTRLGD